MNRRFDWRHRLSRFSTGESLIRQTGQYCNHGGYMYIEDKDYSV
jgi:hypothetical protein